jgi:hypothetical protein
MPKRYGERLRASFPEHVKGCLQILVTRYPGTAVVKVDLYLLFDHSLQKDLSHHPHEVHNLFCLLLQSHNM